MIIEDGEDRTAPLQSIVSQAYQDCREEPVKRNRSELEPWFEKRVFLRFEVGTKIEEVLGESGCTHVLDVVSAGRLSESIRNEIRLYMKLLMLINYEEF